MKYILNEKLILSEKLILAEAQNWKELIQSKAQLAAATPDPNEKKELQNQIQETYDQFYKETWGNVEKVKKLGPAVKIELDSLGFVKELNPFIDFITWLLNNGFELDEKQYGTIHNAYINNLVEDDEIRSVDSEPFKDKNLIRCKDFYTKMNRNDYLSLQKTLFTWLEAADNSQSKENIEKAKATLYIDSSFTKLRSLEDAAAEVKKLTGTGRKMDINIDALKGKIKSNDDVKYAIVGLMTKFGANPNAVSKALNDTGIQVPADFFKVDSTKVVNTYNSLFNGFNIKPSEIYNLISSIFSTFYKK